MTTQVMETVTPYEWILSNSTGGYALGPADLLNHRKYHGLLIAGAPDCSRRHLVSSIEERVEAGGGISFHLDSNHYPNMIYPDGTRYMVKYFLRPYPSFLYSTDPPSLEVLLLKMIQFHSRHNCCVVRYRNMGSVPLTMTLRPKFTLRDHHNICSPGCGEGGEYHVEVHDDHGSVARGDIEAFVYAVRGKITEERILYRTVSYPTEIMRGYPGTEDHYSPVKIVVDLKPGEEETVLFSDRACSSRRGTMRRMVREVEDRYEEYPLPSNHPLHFSESPERIYANLGRIEGIFTYVEYCEILSLAMRDFLMEDDCVAGFPWFSAWGRDTMIAMEALWLLDEGVECSRRILRRYAEKIVEGVIPNTFGEGRCGRNYDTVDGSLWFALRVFQLWKEFDSEEKTLFLRAVAEVVVNYLDNPGLPFHVDRIDGLIDLRPGTGMALTWMDAKVQGEPVTPRYGKPIEINALWYNVLRYACSTAKSEGITAFTSGERNVTRTRLRGLVRKVRISMARYVIRGEFADRIEGEVPVMELRPNYLIALSLPHDIVTRSEAMAGYMAARRELCTPYGLRTLSPADCAFRGSYMGNQRMRDLCYHQGTVWPWLLLPMAKVAAKVFRNDRNRLTGELIELILCFRDGIMRGEMASVPELYDGENPARPKGAPAQCWSVAAILLIERMLNSGRKAR